MSAKGLMQSTFEGRPYPEVIWIGEEPIIGPFCIHCGNPWLSHSPTGRCLNYKVHPLVPNPSCDCHGVEESDDRPVP